MNPHWNPHRPPKYTKEFELWWNATIEPTLTFKNCNTEVWKRDIFLGWKAAQERILKEINDMVTAYPNGVEGNAFILKDILQERIKKL